MNVFDELVVVAGDDKTFLAFVFEFAAGEAAEADGAGAALFGEVQGFQDVSGHAAAAYANDEIPRIKEIDELTVENVVESGIVAPGGHERHVVG